MIPIYICPICGDIGVYPNKKNNIPICLYCESPVVELKNTQEWKTMREYTVDQLNEIAISFQPFEKYKSNAWTHRDHMQRGRRLKPWPNSFNYKYKEGVVHPECPYCHQYWTTKIGGASRMISTGIFGLGSKKIGKQWHCWFCNSDF